MNPRFMLARIRFNNEQEAAYTRYMKATSRAIRDVFGCVSLELGLDAHKRVCESAETAYKAEIHAACRAYLEHLEEA